MKNVWLSTLLGLTLLTAGSVWAAGGQHRLGQDDSRQHQFRNQPTTAETYQNTCPQRNPLCPNLGTGRQNRRQLRDGSGGGTGTCPGTGVCPQARKQIRDRKHDGSCVIAAGQTRTRGGSGTGNGTGTRTRTRTC